MTASRRKRSRTARTSSRPIRKGHQRTRRQRPADELLLNALGARWKVFLAQLARCRRRCLEPAVHDLRVATRRLIAAVDLLVSVSPSSESDKARQQLKRLLKSMGPLRDTQVQILSLQKLTGRFPDLEPLNTILLLQEQRNLKRIAVRLGRVQTPVLRQRINGGVASLRRLMRRSSVRPVLGLTLRGALAAEFTRIVQLRQELDRLNPATIHRMRVAFKKFRYATEILRPDIETRLHGTMNGFQTGMGDIHDLEVLRSSVRKLSARLPAPQKPAATGNRRRMAALGAKLPRQEPSPAVKLTRAERLLMRRYATLVRSFIGSANEVYQFYSLDSVGDATVEKQEQG